MFELLQDLSQILMTASIFEFVFSELDPIESKIPKSNNVQKPCMTHEVLCFQIEDLKASGSGFELIINFVLLSRLLHTYGGHSS